jgi:hypothetical protein
MIKGHLDHPRQNQQSTKPKPEKPTIPSPDKITDANDCFPSINPLAREHTCYGYAAIIRPTGKLYTNQTGKFITPSSNGNNYLLKSHMITTAITFLQSPSRTTWHSVFSILNAYKAVYTKLCTAGLKPKIQRLDNECSAIYKEFLRTEYVDFQLVPPGSHQ